MNKARVEEKIKEWNKEVVDLHLTPRHFWGLFSFIMTKIAYTACYVEDLRAKVQKLEQDPLRIAGL